MSRSSEAAHDKYALTINILTGIDREIMVTSSLVGREGCSQQKPPKLIMNKYLWLSTNMVDNKHFVGFADEKNNPSYAAWHVHNSWLACLVSYNTD